MKQALMALIPHNVRRRVAESSLLDLYATKSYSQCGEDMVLRHFFQGQNSGFYVDVGAHHPKRLSNTYFFYKLGWHGINIDAAPDSMNVFRRLRPRDINLEVAASDVEEILTFYVFNEQALNTLDEGLAESRMSAGHKLKTKVTTKTKPIAQILSQFLPPQQSIDFLSVDVEGHDLAVLRSNNWEKYRPKCVCVECLTTDIREITQDHVYQFLASCDYQFFACAVGTYFFQDSRTLS